MPDQFDNIVGTQCIRQKKNYFSSYNMKNITADRTREKVEKFSGDGWQERYAIIIITYVIKGSRELGEYTLTYMGDANRHIEMMLLKHA
jgi:hypothetical protein